MIQKRTVFVLGAGASAPYEFPTGETLIDEICKLLPTYIVNQPRYGDRDQPYRLHPSFERGALKSFQETLSRARPPSIDAFLASNPQFAEIGKAAIACALIPHEVPEGLLHVEKDLDWYLYLRNEMGTEKTEFLKSAENLFIITFNYDRSLEYYFMCRLAAFHGEQDGLNLIKHMNIVHVYGQLAQPHFLASPGRTTRDYTPRLDHTQVDACIPEIRIISESQDNSEELRRARTWIASAETLCFLGFGYNQTNIDRLEIDKNFPGGKIRGSCFGFTNVELNRIRTRFHCNVAKSVATVAQTIQFGSPGWRARDFLRNSDVFE